MKIGFEPQISFVPPLLEENTAWLDTQLDYIKDNKLVLIRAQTAAVPYQQFDAWHRAIDSIEKGKLNDIVRDASKEFSKLGARIEIHIPVNLVFNSQKNYVALNTYYWIKFHSLLLERLDPMGSSSVTIHVGGLFGSKENSIQKTIEKWNRTTRETSQAKTIKNRCTFENDDRYSFEDLMKIFNGTDGFKITYDVLHAIFVGDSKELIDASADAAFASWKQLPSNSLDDVSKEAFNGTPIIHWSDPSNDTSARGEYKHSDLVNVGKLISFINRHPDKDFDILLENYGGIQSYNQVVDELNQVVRNRSQPK